MAQWIAHWTSNPEVAGSNPVKSVIHVHVKFILSYINIIARLAQLAARRSHNPKVVGSIPTLCKYFIIHAPLAQLVAHWSYVPKVQGSSP